VDGGVWFLAMIIVFTAARLTLVATGVPRTRIRLFRQRPGDPERSGSPDRYPYRIRE
jgi:hypothetical protein